MRVQLPHTERIHELVRFLDENPQDQEAHAELLRLEAERARFVEELLEDQNNRLAELREEQYEVGKPEQYRSLRAQYRDACKLYRLAMELVDDNRRLKKTLRDAL